MKAIASLSGLIGVALMGCAAPVLTAEEMRPQDVRTGMSQSQVDRLLGVPKRSCWNFERIRNVDVDTICFTKGIVDRIATRRPVPGTKEIEYSTEWRKPDQPPSPSATTPEFGMTAAQITKLKGTPSMTEEYYFEGEANDTGLGEYYAFFRNGRLVRFGAAETRCVHGLCMRMSTPQTDDDKP